MEGQRGQQSAPQRAAAKILDFIRDSGLVIPINEEFWIFSASAEGQLSAMIAHELHSDTQALENASSREGGYEQDSSRDPGR